MSSIDYTNPITSGLVAAYVFTDASTTNIVSGSDALTITGDAFLDADGLNCPSTGSFTGAILSSPPSSFKPNDVTVMWFGKINGNGNISNNPSLVGMYYSSSPNVSPFLSYSMLRKSPFVGDILGLYAAGGSGHSLSVSGAIDTTAYGTSVNYILTRTSGATVLYRAGISIGSDSASGNLDYGTSPILLINRADSSSTDNSQTNTALVFIWNRVLTSTEIANLNANPRFFLRGSDFLAGQITLEGLIDSPLVSSFGDGQGDISLEGSVEGGISGFVGDASGDIAIEGSVLEQVLALLGDAQGDIVIEGDITGPLAAVPVECITGDGAFTPSGLGSGNFAY